MTFESFAYILSLEFKLKVIERKKMKVVSSLKTLKTRSKTCKLIRRKGQLIVIDPKNPRNKAKQGTKKRK